MLISYKGEQEHSVLPVEVEINFLGGFRQGAGSRHGPNQEFSGQWLGPFRVELKECQHLQRPESAMNEEEEDDFDDEEPESKEDHSNLLCNKNLRQVVNSVLKNKQRDFQ